MFSRKCSFTKYAMHSAAVEIEWGAGNINNYKKGTKTKPEAQSKHHKFIENNF